MMNFTQNLKYFVFTIFLLCGTLPGAIAQGTLQIEVNEITTTDAMINITTSDNSQFFWKLMEKSAYDQKGGKDKAVENQIEQWKLDASYYDDTEWQEMMSYSLVDNVSISAKQWLYEPLVPNTTYIVFAFGMDLNGNVTVPVTEKTFTTAGAAQSNNTFEISLVSVKRAMEGRMNVTAKVTPSNSDTYIARCIPKSIADNYNLTDPTSESYKKFAKDEVLYGINASWLLSGEKEQTFENRIADTEYYLVAMGVDGNFAQTTDLTLYKFMCEEYPKREIKNITIEVSDVTPMNAHIKITPEDNEMLYYFDVAPSYLVDEKGGVECIPEKFIVDWWKFIADMYEDTKWQDLIPLQTRSGVTDAMAADLIKEGIMSNLYWDMEWTLYAVGFNLDGEIISNTAICEFTTPKPQESDLTFEFKVVSIEDNLKLSTEKNIFFDATIDIFPSREGEEYIAGYCRTIALDQYNGKENGEFEFLTDQFMDMSVSFNESKRIVMEGLRASTYEGDLQEYYLIAIGWNEGPTTALYDYTFSYETIPTGISQEKGYETQITGTDGAICISGPCDGAAVYSVSGQLMGVIRSGRSLSVPTGVYIVTYDVNGDSNTTKVVVK